jgi:hypothetical protein
MNMKWLGTLVATSALLFTVAPPLAAQTQPQPLEYTVTVSGSLSHVRGATGDHFLSFSGPIEIPGVGLAPGTYIFQFPATGVVRVMSQDHSTVYATFFTTPVRRNTSTLATQVEFERSAEGAPLRIAAWFPSGWEYGVAPMYAAGTGPKVQQMAMR